MLRHDKYMSMVITVYHYHLLFISRNKNNVSVFNLSRAHLWNHTLYRSEVPPFKWLHFSLQTLRHWYWTGQDTSDLKRWYRNVFGPKCLGTKVSGNFCKYTTRLPQRLQTAPANNRRPHHISRIKSSLTLYLLCKRQYQHTARSHTPRNEWDCLVLIGLSHTFNAPL